MAARIAIVDIETAPTMAYIWRRWKENIRLDQVVKEGFVICAVAKFLDEKEPRRISIHQTPQYAIGDVQNDEEVVRWCWEIFNEADVIIAHYAKGFDVPMLNARFIALGLPPPRPYKIIDTKEVAAKKFKFPYNSLDGIGEYLGEGRKMDTDFQLWVDCMKGIKRAYDYMLKYCVEDVKLLERVYLRLRPWIDNHPNVALYGDLDRPRCTKCGSDKIKWEGWHRTLTRMYHSFSCKKCGGWGRMPHNATPEDGKPNVTTNAVVS